MWVQYVIVQYHMYHTLYTQHTIVQYKSCLSMHQCMYDARYILDS